MPAWGGGASVGAPSVPVILVTVPASAISSRTSQCIDPVQPGLFLPLVLAWSAPAPFLFLIHLEAGSLRWGYVMVVFGSALGGSLYFVYFIAFASMTF